MKKIVLTLTTAMIFAWQGLSFASSSVDALIQKLEDKGILTAQDATQIKGEIASDEQNSQQNTFKSMLPDWLNSLKFSGDFRLRDQIERVRVAGTTSGRLARNRGRFRARLNMEDQVNDKVKVIFGIATNGENSAGAGNPRSNNITFGGNSTSENAFNKPTAVINKAYAVYTPASWATLMGGKMDNPIWEPASLLWDPNITPEGGVFQLQKKVSDLVTPFSTNAYFILADNTPSQATSGFKTDPYMMITQDGIKGNLTEKVYYKAAGSYYGVSNPNHIVLSNRPSASGLSGTNNTNSFDSTKAFYNNSYDLIGGAVELGINDPFGELLPSPLYVPQVGVFGQFFANLDLSSSQQGKAWQMGAYMGSSALNGWGTWKLQTYYKVLERDSWLDVFPDQDFYNGATDTKGFRTELDLGLAKNVWFVLSWYRTNVFKYFDHLNNGATNDAAYSMSAPQDLVQADLNFKF
jgi:hypothetical protein